MSQPRFGNCTNGYDSRMVYEIRECEGAGSAVRWHRSDAATISQIPHSQKEVVVVILSSLVSWFIIEYKHRKRHFAAYLQISICITDAV